MSASIAEYTVKEQQKCIMALECHIPILSVSADIFFTEHHFNKLIPY